MSNAVTITYYLDLLSSWCHWAEPAWSELKQRYAGRVDFVWKIALMRPEDFPISPAQVEWFYGRSGGTVMRSPEKLQSGWYEPERQRHYEEPNRVVEAARSLGSTGDEVRLALARAALRDGRKIGDLATAVAIAAQAGNLDGGILRRVAESADIKASVEASTAEFFAHKINQRPAFILTSVIGDKAVFSGLARLEPVAAAADAMLLDASRYEEHKKRWGDPPSV